MLTTVRHCRQSAARSPQRGLTLVEVMVAMTIGIILLLALGTLFANSTRVFKVNDDFARMQENGAYALNAIGSDLRQAGFYGLIASSDIQIPTAIAAITNPCGTGLAWATNFAQPLFGFIEGVSTTAADASMPCINASNLISSATDRPSFILVVRGAIGQQVLPAALDAGTLYVQSDPNGGILFRGADYPATAPPRRTILGGAEAPIYPYQAKAYYLRPCSRPTGSGGTVCLATDDGNQPIPTLVRQELVGTTITERAVAEGIEAIRIVYGLDTLDDNGTPDRYTEAPTAVQFAQVVTVRVSVLVRSPKPTNGYNDDSRDYDLNGDGVAELNCTDDGLPCNYHRHVFTQSFQVRNIAQRLESS